METQDGDARVGRSREMADEERHPLADLKTLLLDLVGHSRFLLRSVST
jgi:hypothetical protein